MEPRDVFDGLLFGLLAVISYVHVFGLSFKQARVDTLVEAVSNLNVVVYLGLAGIIGLAFVGYIAIYLPQKQSRDISP
jgi:uncharacterized membrane protein YbhN (UPF0104 family)